MKKEELESAVNQMAGRVEQFGKRLERYGASTAQVQKGFAYLATKLLAVQNRALAAAQGPAEAFSLDMELSALPAPTAVSNALSYPPGVRAAPSVVPVPAPLAPTPSGLTVDQIGGRFVSEARPGAVRGMAAPILRERAAPPPAIDRDVRFIGDEEDEKDSPDNSSDDDVTFVDD